jgi:hypothetical protein
VGFLFSEEFGNFWEKWRKKFDEIRSIGFWKLDRFSSLELLAVLG